MASFSIEMGGKVNPIQQENKYVLSRNVNKKETFQFHEKIGFLEQKLGTNFASRCFPGSFTVRLQSLIFSTCFKNELLQSFKMEAQNSTICFLYFNFRFTKSHQSFKRHFHAWSVITVITNL